MPTSKSILKQFEKALTLFPLQSTVLREGKPVGTVAGYKLISGDLVVVFNYYNHLRVSGNNEGIINLNWKNYTSVTRETVKRKRGK